MNALKRQLTIGCTALVSLPMAGCVERKESITVTRDGRVSMELRYKGDPSDFESGDAMPSEATGWLVETERETDSEGEESITLHAEQEFERGSTLPNTYSDPYDDDADLQLRFPTFLTIERAAGGTYYHFARTYERRPWAQVQYWQDFIMEGDTQKLADKPVEEMTRDDRVALISAFAGIEVTKQVEFAKAALAECAPDLPKHHWLIARQNLLHVFAEDGMLLEKPSLDFLGQENYLDSLMARCDALGNGDHDACYEAEAERVLSISYDAVVQSLRDDAGFRASDVAAFHRSYERARRRHEISNRLGGHHFKVCVEMPGRIIAHNADNRDDPNEDDATEAEVCWEMDGNAIRDRKFDMMVTSFVPASRTGK